MNVSWIVGLADKVTGRIGELLALKNLVVVVGSVATAVALSANCSTKDDQVPAISKSFPSNPLTHSVILA